MQQPFGPNTGFLSLNIVFALVILGLDVFNLTLLKDVVEYCQLYKGEKCLAHRCHVSLTYIPVCSLSFCKLLHKKQKLIMIFRLCKFIQSVKGGQTTELLAQIDNGVKYDVSSPKILCFQKCLILIYQMAL